MSTFERYLTVWVALCIVAGIALGHVMPGVFQAIGGAEIAKVNLPVAALIWLMIVPMLVKIDFAALGAGARALARHRRHAVHQLGGEAVLDGRCSAGCSSAMLFRPYLPAGPDQLLHRRPDHSGGGALHRDGVRLEQPDQGRAALHAVAKWRSTTPSWCSRSRRSSGCCSGLSAITVPWGTLRAVGRALHRGAGHRCAGPAPERLGERRRGRARTSARQRCSRCRW